MKKPKYKTVRCILKHDDRYFLVMHQTRFFSGKKRWGFPGGRLERGEALIEALARELREELYIAPQDYAELGDYRYKGHNHRIYGAFYSEPILKFNRSEIQGIGWHSLEDVRKFRDSGLLHTGFEFDAIKDFESAIARNLSTGGAA
jgi:8-oxo-dGTP pyrophosphatase MutT (NUDIX family)